ncbi:PREDICTED: protein FAM114A2 isoform X2 [Vollenhovia emeryi]|uniref:protein FAM114A2 isoform X2 n=1 Tax=Vollenhovia emeryi TaxID=411798 RepID=UPI0005F58297|nr:PREDICTED: protein FAM114A2 isoform X2 [Vollenhovia emeryi]
MLTRSRGPSRLAEKGQAALGDLDSTRHLRWYLGLSRTEIVRAYGIARLFPGTAGRQGEGGMATSESDADFESADEELGRGAPVKRSTRVTACRTTVDSESDDDTECVQQRAPRDWQERPETLCTTSDAPTGRATSIGDKGDKAGGVKVESGVRIAESVADRTADRRETASPVESEESLSAKGRDAEAAVESSKVAPDAMSRAAKTASGDEKMPQAKPRRDASRQLGARKLGTRLAEDNVDERRAAGAAAEREDKRSSEKPSPSACKDTECRSDERSKTQVAVFQPEGWEGLGDDVELPDELTDEKLQPVLQRLPSANKEERKGEDTLGGWGSWGNWGVTSLISTATASVSTLTSHVSQGLTLLEGTMAAQDPAELEKIKRDVITDDAQPEIQEQESRPYSSFGLGNLMSGVSSITKLVESTGSKVMTGGLDTLEAIGKKTMEVLQDGDPGLKKKRAFFMNESERPNLSQILREAKKKAETEEKTIEERELARKVHFESLFDDYQGLVHLEALEMLSKQCNMKIQHYLTELDTNDLTSVQETLEEIKELCCFSDEDVEDSANKDLKSRLENACHELGVEITYEKLYSVWAETESYLKSSSTRTAQDIFQNAMSTLAQFTAFSVERFHKTAELLLIKERRSTVNEADSLVQLINILSDQIRLLAISFCDTLHRFAENAEKSDDINANITTIFLEAASADSYIQEAFKLFTPILQVGAI